MLPDTTPATAMPARSASRRSQWMGVVRYWLASLAAALCLGWGLAAADEPPVVTLFAAASTTNAVTEIAALYESRGLGRVRPVFAASSTLAQQILRGASADLFLSANIGWMDHLSDKGAIEASSRSNLLGNSLVLITPAGESLDLEIGPGFPLAEALGSQRLAMADPGHVPAGIYAKAALTELGVWAEVQPKAAFAASVRGALAFVDSGAAAAGIVYTSDAAISRRVRIVGQFAEASHPDIAYPLAVVAGRDSEAVRRFYDFLRGPEARAVFRRFGFKTPTPEG